MCHLLEFKYGTLNKWGAVAVINNHQRKPPWLFVHLTPFVPPRECAHGTCVYYNMHVCLCETRFFDVPMTMGTFDGLNAFLPLIVKHAAPTCRCAAY